MCALPVPARWVPPPQDPSAAPARWPTLRRVYMSATLAQAPSALALTTLGGTPTGDFPSRKRPAMQLVVRGHKVLVFPTGTVLTLDTPDVSTALRTLDELVVRLGDLGLSTSFHAFKEVLFYISGAIGRRVDTRVISKAFDGELDDDLRFEFELPDPAIDDYAEFPGCNVSVRPNGEVDVMHQGSALGALKAFLRVHEVLHPFFAPCAPASASK